MIAKFIVTLSNTSIDVAVVWKALQVMVYWDLCRQRVYALVIVLSLPLALYLELDVTFLVIMLLIVIFQVFWNVVPKNFLWI